MADFVSLCLLIILKRYGVCLSDCATDYILYTKWIQVGLCDMDKKYISRFFEFLFDFDFNHDFDTNRQTLQL